MSAQDFPITSIGNDLHPTGGLSQTERFPIGLKGKAAHLDLRSAFFRLSFDQTERGNLKLTVHGARHVVVIQDDRLRPGDIFSTDNPLG